MKIAHRISAFASRLDELQACLGRAANQATENVTKAQRIAAELALSLEDWHLDALRIPKAERAPYRAQNPYYSAH